MCEYGLFLSQIQTNICSSLISGKELLGLLRHGCAHRRLLEQIRHNVRLTLPNLDISSANSFDNIYFNANSRLMDWIVDHPNLYQSKYVEGPKSDGSAHTQIHC